MEEVTASEPVLGGRKRLRQPDKRTRKHVKRPGLRKNSPKIDLSTAECCNKGCIQSFPTSHLIQKKISEEFKEMLYGDQNTYLNGLLHRYETKKQPFWPKAMDRAKSLVTHSAPWGLQTL